MGCRHYLSECERVDRRGADRRGEESAAARDGRRYRSRAIALPTIYVCVEAARHAHVPARASDIRSLQSLLRVIRTRRGVAWRGVALCFVALRCVAWHAVWCWCRAEQFRNADSSTFTSERLHLQRLESLRPLPLRAALTHLTVAARLSEHSTAQHCSVVECSVLHF